MEIQDEVTLPLGLQEIHLKMDRLYAYLHNSPLTDFDLYGLWSWRNSVRNCDNAMRTRIQSTFLMTYRCGGNFFTGVPTAIVETGFWIYAGTARSASWTSRGIYQAGEYTFGRFALNNSAKGMMLSTERNAAFAMERQIAQKLTPKGEALFGHVDKIEKNLNRFRNEIKNVKYDLDALSKSGQALDRGGLTKAGRALDKHGARPDSMFPKARGNLALNF